MKNKLTPLAKIFIAVVIVGVIAYLTIFESGKKRPGLHQNDAAPTKPTVKASGNRITIGVNDFGGAYPLIFANGGTSTAPGSIFKEEGLDVEIKIIRGSKERLAAFDDGEVDIMLLTLDYLANLAPIYQQKDVALKSFLLVDWSRGNIGIVAKPGFDSIESLKNAKIATTRNTPTHYLLLSLFAKTNMTPADIETAKSNLVFATKTPQAGELFNRGEVDAVAIWEPHLTKATVEGKGHILMTTATATNLVADVLFARAPYLKAHEKELTALARGYFSAVERIAANPRIAVAVNATAFKQRPDEISNTLSKIKPATFADNRVFFGLETEDSPYNRLYLEASRFWQKEGLIANIVEPAATKWLRVLEALAPEHASEHVVENFHFDNPPASTAMPLLTKSVSIYFDTGKAAMDPNARRVIDEFVNTLGIFQNAYIRIEGNTDNVGSRKQNVKLSQERAQSVIQYLTEHHRLASTRFIAVGNGPDRPTGDNRTPEGRELNRRTDFKIIPNL